MGQQTRERIWIHKNGLSNQYHQYLLWRARFLFL